MKVTVIVGGMNEPSNSNTLAEAFIAGLQKSGLEIMKFRLKDVTIEHFEVGKHYADPPQSSDDYYQIERSIADSAAIVIASPIWNFSVPAHLKNFVDRLGACGLDPVGRSKGMLKGMPLYFIFTGGTPLPAWTSMLSITTSHMPESLRFYGASPMGTHFEGRCTVGRGVFGLVVDKRPESLQALQKKGEDFGALVKKYSETGKLPLKNQILYRIFRFGYALVNKLVYAFS